jgi:hypothetical protein
MSTIATASNSLPSQFILYVPTRSTSRDPFAQYFLINTTATSDGKATRLDSAPQVAYYMPSYIIKKIPPQFIPYTGLEVPLHTILLNINNNMPLGATFMKQLDRVVYSPDGGPPLIILRLYHGKLTNFLPSYLKRNIPLKEEKPSIITSPAPPVVSPPLLTPVGGAGTAPASMPLLDVANQISQILSAPIPPIPLPPSAAAAMPAPVPKKKKVTHPSIPAVGELNPHVAKQLLALARLRKEECPIIAEEYTEGNTAVMPCGHLFSRLGIEESFKKEPRKCPACRSSGNPTFV